MMHFGNADKLNKQPVICGSYLCNLCTLHKGKTLIPVDSGDSLNVILQIITQNYFTIPIFQRTVPVVTHHHKKPFRAVNKDNISTFQHLSNTEDSDIWWKNIKIQILINIPSECS